MLSDTPYEVSEFVFHPLVGAAVGLAAAAVAGGAIYAGLGGSLGQVMGISEAVFRPTAVAGLLGLGTFWGALYGSSQQEIPNAHLYGVAVFFALFLWVVDNLGARLLVRDPALNQALRSLAGVGMHLIYTLCLATAVVCKRMLAPTHRKILPKD